MEKLFECHQYLFSFLFGLFTSIGTIGACVIALKQQKDTLQIKMSSTEYLIDCKFNDVKVLLTVINTGRTCCYINNPYPLIYKLPLMNGIIGYHSLFNEIINIQIKPLMNIEIKPSTSYCYEVNEVGGFCFNVIKSISQCGYPRFFLHFLEFYIELQNGKQHKVVLSHELKIKLLKE